MRNLTNCSVAALALAVTGLAPRVAFADGANDPHAHHREMAKAAKQARGRALDVKLPDIKLVRSDGKTVSLADELNDGRPVVLNFIFTSCTTICPVMSQIFTQLQTKLGDEHGRVHMVSISIDPEQDTPERLTEYARRFHAGDQWQFYTGTAEASLAAQRAFTAFRGDKMDHTPVTFLRAAGAGSRWVRIDGFASSDDLLGELHQLLAAR
jgi:protein SCO1